MYREIDFEALASALQDEILDLLPRWLPGGKKIGNEYMCANLNGGQGKKNSLRVNIAGKGWKDFATGDSGGDLISLYAAIQGIKNIEAAKFLNSERGDRYFKDSPNLPAVKPKVEEPKERLSAPPEGVAQPSMLHPGHGKPSKTWTYKDLNGQPIFYVARYDTDSGKEVVPWSWSVDRKKFVMKNFSEKDRPIYGLDRLLKRPTAQVIIVEGEKSADACDFIFRELGTPSISWPSGSNAWQLVDWRPLLGRKILLWPDSDRKVVKPQDRKWLDEGLKLGDVIPAEFQPGLKAMLGIAEILKDFCAEIKIINTPIDLNKKDGWDAADALEEALDWKAVVAWASPLVKIYDKTEIIPAAKKTDAPKEEEDRQAQEEDFSSPGHLHATWEEMGIALTKNGSPICNFDNALRVFERWTDLKDIVWFDEFHQKFFTLWGSPKDKEGHQKPREWTDIDDLLMLGFFQRELGMSRMSDDTIRKAVIAYGQKHKRNEPVDWLKSLEWDKQPRIKKFMHECLGTDDTPYHDVVSKNFWVSMVARLLVPGIKVDNMVILEGEQGKFKSTALDLLGGNWYTETHELPTDDDFYMILQGKLVIEISEFHSFLRADQSAVKAAITRRTDRYRPPYAHKPADFPRQCIFVGTINEDAYLSDHTGGRRFWPVRIGIIDLDRIKEFRSQLFAEAAFMFAAGEKWYEAPPGATEEQEARRQSDSWEDIINEYLSSYTAYEDDGISILDVMINALGQPISSIKRADQLRVGRIMRAIGWALRITQKDGKPVRVFYKPKL